MFDPYNTNLVGSAAELSLALVKSMLVTSCGDCNAVIRPLPALEAFTYLVLALPSRAAKAPCSNATTPGEATSDNPVIKPNSANCMAAFTVLPLLNALPNRTSLTCMPAAALALRKSVSTNL